VTRFWIIHAVGMLVLMSVLLMLMVLV